MDKDLIRLAEENKVEELRNVLKDASNDELCKLVERKLHKGRGDSCTLIRALMLGSVGENFDDISRKCAVYKLCIGILQKNEMHNKLASELIGLLMLEADMLPGVVLAELAGIYVDSIKSGAAQSGKALELLPKVLSAIACQDSISYGGNRMKGTEYKNHVLNSLCSCRWDSSMVLHLASMFRDVPLSQEELQFVIVKILRMFKEVGLQDLPALVYQLLLLSTKGHKRLVLDGIIQFFTEQDALQRPSTSEQEFSEDLLDEGISDQETLRHTEGTVILHISFAVKQHQDLGREYVKCLKSKQLCSAAQCLTPFNLALALSLSRIHRFEDQIHDLLKALVLKSYRDREKIDQSHWVQEIVSSEHDLESYVLDTVQNSTYGWDHVVQGLVQMGFILMDSFGPKAVFGRVDSAPVTPTGPTHHACQLGSKILLNTFKAHEMVRSEILEQIFNRVVTKATSPVKHFLDLLGNTVYASPQLLLDSTSKVREMFDYLSFLSPGSAEGLLRAIQPLLKLSMSLKDSLILVLRKAMFSRQLDSRKIGAGGFLMILKHFRVLGGLCSSQASQASISASQVQVDVHIPYNPSSNEALCLEILGNLRRCLTQQADVRLLLYQGLYEVLERNTQIKDAILEVLLAQFKGYYEKNESVNPPLKLDPCLVAQGEQVFLAEPLAHLLCSIQLCLVKSAELSTHQQHDDDEDDESSAAQTELQNILESLKNRMITSEMEDFELDKSADFSLANSVGVRNNIFAILVMGTYEILMEYNFMIGNMSEESIRSVLQLFENYKKLSDTLREKTAAAAGKKSKAAAAKIPQSLLSIRMITRVMEVVISRKDVEEGSTVEALCQNTDFLKYILSVTQQKLQQIQEKGTCDGAEGKDKAAIFNYCCTLGRLLLYYYVENQKSDEDQRVREKQILSQSLEGLLSLVTIVTQHHGASINKFLMALEKIGPATEERTTEERIYYHITKVQRLVMNILTADEDNQNVKDIGYLLNIIFQLSKALSRGFEKTEHQLTWLEKICREQSIDDLSLCKSLVSHLLSLAQKVRSSPLLVRDLAQDVHTQLGDIDQEIELESRTNFEIITARSAAPTVVTLILQHCERELEDTDWVIARVKADNAAAESAHSGSESPQMTQIEGHEKSICTRLGILIGAFHEVVQSALPIGTCTELVMKVVTRLYGTLTNLVKYYLSLYSSKSGGRLSGRFEKLVKLSGTHLTQYCYAMITYIQSAEAEKIQHAAPDKGKKKKNEKKGGNHAEKTNVLKQTRTIPNLIFAIEQYERYLIQLTKKSKTDLMEHMKHSTSRDFRINVAVLAERLDEGSDSDVEMSSDEGEAGADNQDESTAAPAEEVSRQEGSDESEQENEPPPVENTQENAEPAKKKAKLKGRRTVGKKSQKQS